MIKVSTLKKNPKNPRQIKGEKLDLLKKSVASFQKMMELRPMIVDENNIVLGGNMRLAAIKALGLKEIPDEWVKRVDNLTEDEKAEFVIKDNAGFGEWDWDSLANEWDDWPLIEWGLELPVTASDPTVDVSSLGSAGDTYLNSAIRQIVLYYDIDMHQDVLDRLGAVGKANGIEADNSSVVLRLLEVYEGQNR